MKIITKEQTYYYGIADKVTKHEHKIIINY